MNDIKLIDKIKDTNTIKNLFAKKGYKYFTQGKYNLNIIGWRADNQFANFFDDVITVSYFDDNGVEQLHKFKATTDPGNYWLEHPMNVLGTAILCPGQYRNVYEIGRHNNYTALRQCKPMKYWRDNNRDTILNMHGIPDQEGVIYTNLHRANPNRESKRVEKWSAGCQVIADPDDFDLLMLLAHKQKDVNGWKTFTYTLCEERDL